MGKGEGVARFNALILGLAGAPLVALGLSWSVPASAESLLDALAKAYSTNPELLGERANLRATDEKVPQALANWRPTVKVTGEAGWERTDDRGDPPETLHPKSVELSISQPLYRGGRTVNETLQAEAEVEAARAKLRSVEQQVLLGAARAYMDVLRDDAVLALNRANEQRLARQLQAARDRFGVGEITRTDVAQAEARLARAKADRIQAEGVLVNSREAYRRVIGDAPGKLSTPKLALSLPRNSDESRVQGQDNNPDVVNARYLEKAAGYSVSVVRGELLPSVSLKGAVGHSRETSSPNSRRDRAELMAELSVPLYQQGAVYSSLREARHVLSRRRQELEDARRTAVNDAASTWNSLQTTRAAVESFRAEVRANEIALDGVQREALVGSRTVLDVLDAEQELLDARVSLVRAERNELVARFELLSAVGRLSAANLKLAVEPYNPEDNQKRVRDRWFGGDISEKDAAR